MIAICIDCVVTALHLLLPICWIVIAPMEVIAVLAYIVPALLLGSPTANTVPYTVIDLLSLTVFAAIDVCRATRGRRAFERQKRQLFAGFLAEKQRRFQAELQLSRVTNGEAARAEDLGSDRSALSRPGATMSAAAFNSSVEHASLDQVHAIGRREQWLIEDGELELLPDRVLGEGEFGIVALGSYQNAPAAVKAPKGSVNE
ncbi:unnamed protein product [Prorocentrum cordatum]|uniref:Uncharacterized protein n=1 Tax=Prorocentrum cordatum TaxID=2364126 RepID=A0ABN9U4A6_9DINO|nr:unnamed protein product [Polarella glacialis]